MSFGTYFQSARPAALRLAILATALGAVFVALGGPGPSAAATRASADAPAALTQFQLDQLHKVTAWRVHTEYSVDTLGLVTGGPAAMSCCSAGKEMTGWSGKVESHEHFTGTVDVLGQPGCDIHAAPTFGCAADYTTPGHATLTYTQERREAIDFSAGCSGADGAGAQNTSQVSAVSGDVALDGTPNGVATGALGIDYRTNPPLADAGLSVPSRGSTTVTYTGCVRDDGATTGLATRNGIFDYFDGDTAVAVVNGKFVLSGGVDRIDSNGGACISFFVACSPSTSFSVTKHTAVQWTATPLCAPVTPADLQDPRTADAMVDLDGDAIPDCWEQEGVRVKEPDGSVKTVLTLAGANVGHKDVFVEVDYMQGYRPLDGALADVAAAFAAAPVSNPDGVAGVALHSEVDDADTIDVVPNLAFDLPHVPAAFPVDFWTIKSGEGLPCTGAFGTPDQRRAPECAQTLAAKHLLYHYALFGDGALNETTHSANTTRSGVSEEGGNDLNVTIGNWTAQAIADATGLRSVQARTYMHELGHNLGLDHGGDQITPTDNDPTHTLNCKPNYLSVMNYLYADRIGTLDPNEPLDYSRAALPALDQDHLLEAAGIGGPNGWTMFYGLGGLLRAAPADGPVDWNGDRAISADPVVGEIDNVDTIGDCYQDSYIAGNVVVLKTGKPMDPAFVPPASAFTIAGSDTPATSVSVIGDSVRIVFPALSDEEFIRYIRPANGALRSADGSFVSSQDFRVGARAPLRGYDDWAHLFFNFRHSNPSSLQDGIGVLAHPDTPDVTAEQVVQLYDSAPANTAPPSVPTTPSSTVPTATGAAPPSVRTSRADISLHATAAPSVRAGEPAVVAIALTNKGEDTATDVSLRDILPAILSPSAAVPTQGSCQLASTVTCSLGSIAPGNSATLTLTLAGTARGIGTSVITVGAAEDDPHPADNSSTLVLLVRQPPVLTQSIGAFRPPLSFRAGRTAADVNMTFSVDEAALVNVRLLDGKRERPLTLLPGSKLGRATSGRTHHSLSHSVDAAGVLAIRLRVARHGLVRGHAYVIVVRALDRNGDASELRIPVRY